MAVDARSLWLGIAVCACSCACVGIPLQRTTMDHIVATGWAHGGAPVVLAREVRLKKTAYVASPEGGGVFDDYDVGEFVLLEAGARIPVDIPRVKDILHVSDVAARPGQDIFVMLVHALVEGQVTSREDCYVVQFDGSARPCPLPAGYVIGGSFSYISPDGREIRSRRHRSKDPWFQALDIDTGGVETIPNSFLTLGLRAPLDGTPSPCEFDRVLLSPSAARWAAICILPVGGRPTRGIWILEPDAPPRLAYRFETWDPPIPSTDTRPWALKAEQEMLWWPREATGLAWSPDETRLYYCGRGETEGVLLAFDDAPPVLHAPCLRLASWSPDGTTIAGATDAGFRTWRIADAN